MGDVMKELTEEQAAKLHESMKEAVEIMALRIADINEKEAIKCIVEAIRSGDFTAYIVHGDMLGVFNYKPYHDMDRIRQSNALLSAEVELLKGELKFYMNPIAGDGL